MEGCYGVARRRGEGQVEPWVWRSDRSTDLLKCQLVAGARLTVANSLVLFAGTKVGPYANIAKWFERCVSTSRHSDGGTLSLDRIG